MAWHHPGTQHSYVSVSGYQKLANYTAPRLGPELYGSLSPEANYSQVDRGKTSTDTGLCQAYKMWPGYNLRARIAGKLTMYNAVYTKRKETRLGFKA